MIRHWLYYRGYQKSGCLLRIEPSTQMSLLETQLAERSTVRIQCRDLMSELLSARRLKKQTPHSLTPKYVPAGIMPKHTNTTHNMATPFCPFDIVPSEILLLILGSVNATDHLSVKLVSKSFHGCAVNIDTRVLTLSEAAKCHAAIEASIPRHRALVCCCCTYCGLVKDTDQFSDPQTTKKTKETRTCIACGIRRLIYSNKRLPSVGGERRIPCYDCLRSQPQYEGWESRSAEAAILLRLGAGKIYCEQCLECRLRFVKRRYCFGPCTFGPCTV